MIPEPHSRNVKVPIFFIDGKPRLFPDAPFPKLKDGTVGDLVVPAGAFEDLQLVAELTRETKQSFLPVETTLAALVNPEKVPLHLQQHLINRIPGHTSSGVEFKLKEEQFALLRSAKNTSLMPCRCWIPCLEKEAKSINHTYSLISQVFEPHRISHTGNVFDKVYFHDGNIWRPLRARRGL